ncbi:MAG: DMT family transporter [Clostridiaceae bacterium]
MKNDKKLLRRGHLIALCTVMMWGFAPISTKYLLNDFSAVDIFFYRIVIAYAVLLVAYPRFLQYKNLREEICFALAGFTGVTLNFMLGITAISYSYASNVAVLSSISPFFTAVMAYIFYKEKLKSNFIIGFIISITGIALISFNGSHMLKLNPAGDVLAILAAAVWATYCIFLKKINTFNYNIILYSRKIIFYGILFLIPILVYTDFHLKLEAFIHIPNLLNMLFLAVLASAIAYISWNYSVEVLGPVKASAYLYMGPVLTMIGAAFILSERITPVSFIGMVMILAGVYLSERQPKEKQGSAQTLK